MNNSQVVSIFYLNIYSKAPPSYHEAVGNAVQLNEEGEHTLGSTPFNPMYPVYNFNNNQQLASQQANQQLSSQINHPYGFIGESSNAQPSAPPPGGTLQKY